MGEQTIKILKNVGLIGLIIGGLSVLGNVINSIIPWGWLTNFFIIIRNLLALIDYFIDTNTLITLIGLRLSIEIAYWSYKAIIWVVSFFKD